MRNAYLHSKSEQTLVPVHLAFACVAIFALQLVLAAAPEVLFGATSTISNEPGSISSKRIFRMDGFQPSSISWAPNGKTLAVAGGMRGDPMQIWIVDIEKGDKSKVSEGLVRSPVFSDDNTLFFAKKSNGSMKLIRKAIDRRKADQLRAEESKDDFPAGGELASDGAGGIVVSTTLTAELKRYSGSGEKLKSGQAFSPKFASGNGRRTYVDPRTNAPAVGQEGDAELLKEGSVKYYIGRKRRMFVIDDGRVKRLYHVTKGTPTYIQDLPETGRYRVFIGATSNNGLSFDSGLFVEDLKLQKKFAIELPSGSAPCASALSPSGTQVAWIDQNGNSVWITEVQGLK